MDSKEIIKFSIAGLGSTFTYLFGGCDSLLIALVTFIVIDYISGLMAGGITGQLDSRIGFKGILRKSAIFIVLIVSVVLDRLINDGWIFRTMVCWFYIANEGLSILENVGKCGVKYPEGLIKRLKQLQENNNEKDNNSIKK